MKCGRYRLEEREDEGIDRGRVRRSPSRLSSFLSFRSPFAKKSFASMTAYFLSARATTEHSLPSLQRPTDPSRLDSNHGPALEAPLIPFLFVFPLPLITSGSCVLSSIRRAHTLPPALLPTIETLANELSLETNERPASHLASLPLSFSSSFLRESIETRKKLTRSSNSAKASLPFLLLQTLQLHR